VTDGWGESVDRARAGDRQALSLLVHEHYGPLRAFLVRYGCGPDDVDDVVQETFVRVFRSLDRYEHRGSFRTWLYRIGLNLARDALRRAGRTVTQPDLEPLSRLAEDPADVLMARVDSDRLAATLAKLPESQRAALVLRFYADLPVEEIARICRCPTGTVKSRIHYALRKLRGMLAQGGDAGGTRGESGEVSGGPRVRPAGGRG